MSDATTIQLDKDLVVGLKELREYPRQTYKELIRKMMGVYKGMKSRNQYDEFLHKVQQAKMKELWDNQADEDWAHA